MKDEMLREFLRENFPESVIFDNPEFDNSIVGISSQGNLIYDLDRMVQELAEDDNISEDEAFEFIDQDTIRLLTYISQDTKPMIVDFNFKELYN